MPYYGEPILVPQETGDSKSQTHSRPAECYSRQAIQARPDPPDRVVSPSSGFPVDMLPVAPASSGVARHHIQQQIASPCITGTRPLSMGNGCTQSDLGGSGMICLPTSSHFVASSGEVARLPVQKNYSDCPRVAQHALVWGPSVHVEPNPTVPALSVDSTIQSDLSQESIKPASSCLAPRASAIKEQDFPLWISHSKVYLPLSSQSPVLLFG